MALSAWAVEYSDWISVEVESPNDCPRYDIKQSDGEVLVMLELCGMQVPLYCHRSQVHSDSES